MPRFDRRNPRRDQASEFQNSDDSISSNQSRGFSRFLDVFRKQKKDSVLFPEVVLEKLEPIWSQEIEPILIEEFGRLSTLYIIFYLSKKQDEIIMEIWDPNYVNTKPSQVFMIQGVPGSALKYFPKNRSQAEIGILQDWN